MKVLKSSVFIGSTKICNEFKRRDPKLDYYSGSDQFNGVPDEKDIMLIRLNGYYVVLDEITGPNDFAGLVKSCKGGYDSRFLRTRPFCLRERYIDMEKPPVRYFLEDGVIPLKDLKKIQAQEKEAKEHVAGV